MDTYRKLLDVNTGAGGVKCDCCNWTKVRSSKQTKVNKIKLKKKVRAKMKANLQKAIVSEG